MTRLTIHLLHNLLILLFISCWCSNQ